MIDVSSTLSLSAPATTSGTAIIPAKAARICCKANTIDTPTGALSSILYKICSDVSSKTNFFSKDI